MSIIIDTIRSMWLRSDIRKTILVPSTVFKNIMYTGKTIYKIYQVITSTTICTYFKMDSSIRISILFSKQGYIKFPLQQAWFDKKINFIKVRLLKYVCFIFLDL